MARTQSGSMRTKIIDKLQELQEKHGPFLTDKNNIPEDHPARKEYIEWYLRERADDIGKKHPKEHFEKWAIVHLQDSLKHRKEAAKELATA